MLSNQIGSKVTIGRADLGFLNRVILDDMTVYDKEGQEIIRAAHTAVTLDMAELLNGNIDILTGQLFGVKARLSRQTVESPLNIQYIIDAFSSEDKQSPTQVNLRVSSFILRHVNVSYDVLSEEKKAPLFDINHLNISNLGMTASVRVLTDDSLNISVRRLNFTETNSGLALKKLETAIAANHQVAFMDSLLIQTGQSTLRLGEAKATFADYEQTGRFNITTSVQPSEVMLAEFSPLLPVLSNFTSPLQLQANLKASDQQIVADDLQLSSTDRSMVLMSDVQLSGLHDKTPDASVKLHQLTVSPPMLSKMLTAAGVDESIAQPLTRLGNIELQGNLVKESDALTSELAIRTDAGNANVNADYILGDDKYLSAHLQSESIDLGKIVANDKLGQACFSLDMEGELSDLEHPSGNIYGDISAIDINGYTYNNIFVDGTLGAHSYAGLLNVDDEHLKLAFDGTFTYSGQNMDADMILSVTQFEPYMLNLTKDYEGEDFSFTAQGKVKGHDLASACGTIVLDSIRIKTPEQVYTAQAISINAQQITDEKKQIQIQSDIIDATFVGNINYTDIVPSFQNQLAQHLPSLIDKKQTVRKMDTSFDFSMEVTETPLVQHFISADISLLAPARIAGRLNAVDNSSNIQVYLPRVEYEGTLYENVQLSCNGSPSDFRVSGTTIRRQDDGVTNIDIGALAHQDVLNTHLSWKQHNDITSEGILSAKTVFAKKDNQLNANIHIQPSQISFNDTTWLIKPADIMILDKKVQCHNLEVSNRNRFIKVNGTVSEQASDSLVVQMNNVDVDYVLSLVDFTAVDFKGRAFGNAYISNVYKKPKFNAVLRVEDMAIGTGRLGVGNIRAHWDEDVNGIRINGHIVDADDSGNDRITDCNGYVSPADNYIHLGIAAHNTNASFLNDFLGSIFDDIHGSANGVMNVTGPLNDINLIGDMSTDVSLTLHATNVKYRIDPTDTLRFRPNRFSFENVRIYDKENNIGRVNGKVTHRNVKNFAYEFRIDMQQLMAYEETAFNSDKFMGSVYANGTLTVKGADRNPLYINADVTPTRGSFFAYDAATPDAIASSSFITFHDATTTTQQPYPIGQTVPTRLDDYIYRGDIFMNVAIHLNPDCAVKLRMDNADDGYITTYGTGRLQASYHNKGTFTLNGTYSILSGSYRLYLQDIIYRDLSIQDGSSVVFNGNPFDADIHLLCHHTINSVPLTDLTAGVNVTSSNKVKVICVLDIAGKLGNMNFKFDLNLPNVNDETRQLVRSYINTEEDMNMQMIYLLGFGRFYTNEYARSMGETGGSQTVNTLLSSTISGQVNQMLSNAIGNDSKWNFGTGLSTGEQGWNDLDVEGTLSGRLLDDRLLINGNFGYRDNTLTQNSSFIGDFDLKWRIREGGNTYIKAYNKTNDRYFTKATLNTQGIGISYQRDFEHWRSLFRRRMSEETPNATH